MALVLPLIGFHPTPRRLQTCLLALALVGLLAAALTAVVLLAVRNALGINRDTIEIVHLLGGTDAQIARLFQRSIGIDAAGGGAVGLALGALVVLFLGRQFAGLGAGLVDSGALGLLQDRLDPYFVDVLTRIGINIVLAVSLVSLGLHTKPFRIDVRPGPQRVAGCKDNLRLMVFGTTARIEFPLAVAAQVDDLVHKVVS